MNDHLAPHSLDDTLAMAGVLSREQIRAGMHGEPPLMTDLVDLETQLQPNGIDLTLREVRRFGEFGVVACNNDQRVLPELEPMAFGPDGFLDLPAGPYHIVYNEVVNLPRSLMALGRPRSSLGRCGVTIHTAVWDAGYHGRSTSLLVVSNPSGFRVERNARVMQLVFFSLAKTANEGYRGIYQGENLAR
jgi:dUTP pyrophosphatase